MKKLKTFLVTYNKKIGGNGTILVIAENADKALINAYNSCHTGSCFRDAVVTTEKYIKPRKQGFAGKF